MKYVAWGTSKLLWLYKEYINDIPFAYVVDSSPKVDTFMDLSVYAADKIEDEDENVTVVIFAVSNKTINLILASLARMGRQLGTGVILYADLFKDSFQKSLKEQLGWDADTFLIDYSTAFTLNSLRPVHTSICGSWLFLEALRKTSHLTGAVAEVGAYQGGNALCSLLSPLYDRRKDYYIFDSFEGFPDVSKNDPDSVSRGTYAIDISVQEIHNPFSPFPHARIIKGYIPETLSQLKPEQQFSIVFYDCDLYQPALDTYTYFWERLQSGGVLLIHDYYAEPNGFHGVRQATDEYFKDKDVTIAHFPHNTMAAIVKP